MKKPILMSVKASMLSIILKFIYGTNKIIVKGKENIIYRYTAELGGSVWVYL